MVSTDFFRFYNVKKNANVAFQPGRTENIHRLTCEFAGNEPLVGRFYPIYSSSMCRWNTKALKLRGNLKMNS